MELFVASMAIVGLATTICAIDESIDWMDSYRREGEDHLRDHYPENTEYGIDYRE